MSNANPSEPAAGKPKKLTKKAFREFLNRACPNAAALRGTVNGSGRAYGAITRPYGDYLYAQDREMFDVQYEEWVEREGAY